LLPEPEGRAAPFVTSAVINLVILATILLVTMTARHVIQQHYEQVELLIPNTPPPPKPKPVAMPPVPPPPVVPKVQLDAQKIAMPKPKPEPKPIQMEAKIEMPVVKPKEQQVVLAPQPKAALTATMPAQNNEVKASTAPVHLGETFGVTANPNATRPATVAAIGNINGGMQGPAVAPHGVVGSTGIGNGLTSGSSSGMVGKVASAGIPASATSSTGNYGKVASAGIPTAVTAAPVKMTAAVQSTNLEVLSKPPVQYTSEARQLKVEGDVILRVTFTANGQVQVQGVVHGLGHGLDEEARRVAQQIRFRPATKNGVPVDLTTNITITFQLA
jgi:TonB family protein